jgi:hypothetical protein
MSHCLSQYFTSKISLNIEKFRDVFFVKKIVKNITERKYHPGDLAPLRQVRGWGEAIQAGK